MNEIPARAQKRRERIFALLCLAAAALCAGAAFYFAVPLQMQPPQLAPDTKALTEYLLVDLNTAGVDALCTLPGVGRARAQAIIDYREQYGPFAKVEDAANVPGLTLEVVSSWGGQAYAETAEYLP